MDTIFAKTTERMEKCLDSLDRDFSTIRAGRANPNVLNNVMVDYYGRWTYEPGTPEDKKWQQEDGALEEAKKSLDMIYEKIQQAEKYKDIIARAYAEE